VDRYITCYTARLVHFRDDVEDYRTATYSFKIHQGRRIFLQVRELSQKLGSMLRTVVGTLQVSVLHPSLFWRDMVLTHALPM